ncbi:MAG: hypothetical protein H6604_07230 [Flavobacteriales bacterium]|nr:hypothetical protein [Flavobacteriales bacterium]
MNNSLFNRIRKSQGFLDIFAVVMVWTQILYPALLSAKSHSGKHRLENSSLYSKIELNNSFSSSVENEVKESVEFTKEENPKNQISSINNVNSDGTILTTKDKKKSTPRLNQFDADILSGTIGTDKDINVDLAYDNVFTININRDLDSDEVIYLEYDLYGLKSSVSTLKSINDVPAIGGYVIQKNHNWTIQRELLDETSLHKGINTVKFFAPADKDVLYRIKNLRLVTEKKLENNAFFVQNDMVYRSGNTLYLQGVLPSSEKNYQLEIAGKKHTFSGGSFELIQQIDNKLEEIEVKCSDDSQVYTKKIPVVEVAKDEFTATKLVTSPSSKKYFNKDIAEHIELEKTSLEVPANILKESKIISVYAVPHREVMPITSEMINVTADYGAYRYLPHGHHFSEPVKLSIGYDAKKIPAGYTANDIQTFYFDEQQKKWLAVSKDSVDINNQRIISKTTHFTDYINGIIKVPESPETGNFTPTMMSDIKAADPSTGVVSIAPPTPNNMGTVNTSFPIKLPAGRKGVQPSLQVTYNSEGGNGWMGLGWDLSIPSISIDTRWGVPRYETDYESETYSIGGDQLTYLLEGGTTYTLPHRRDNYDNISRDLLTETREDGTTVSYRQLYPRIEGGYAKIIRYGGDPTNFRFVVTGKDGTKNYYGGDENDVHDNSVIKTATGNVAHWGLWKTEDKYGNYVEYFYDVNEDNQLYIQKIEYTKHIEDNSTHKDFYTVEFKRDEGSRPDKIINARLGVVQKTSDRLSEIIISSGVTSESTPGFPATNESIRSYQFEYKDNVPFQKTLLASIAEYDEKGNLFYKNTMDYEDHTDGGTNLFEDEEVWGNSKDAIEGPIDIPFTDLDEELYGKYMGSINGSTSKSRGGGAAVTVGLNEGRLTSKDNTAGIYFNKSNSTNEGMLTLVDVDGDNIPDKVFKKGSGFVYRKGEEEGFSSEKTPLYISNISRTTSSSTSFGLESNFKLYAGATYNNNKSRTSIYFQDVNGDGLIDLVEGGKVRYNIYGSNITNQNYSTNTDNPVGYLIGETEYFNPDTSETPKSPETQRIEQIAQLNQEYPLHDAVKVWVAPVDGNITISGTATLGTDSVDGARIFIQKNGDKPIVNYELKLDDSTTPLEENKHTHNNSISNIKKGDRIYFRVHSINNGEGDSVEWEPKITYTGITEPKDPNGLPYFSSKSSDGFILSSPQMLVGQKYTPDADATNEEKVKKKSFTFESNLTLANLSNLKDEVTFTINITKTVADGENTKEEPVEQSPYTYVYTPGDTSISFVGTDGITIGTDGTTIESIDFSTDGEYNFSFEVSSPSNVNWGSINWQPTIKQIKKYEDSHGLIRDQEDTLYGIVDYKMYNTVLTNNELLYKSNGTKFTIPTGTTQIQPVINTSFPTLITKKDKYGNQVLDSGGNKVLIDRMDVVGTIRLVIKDTNGKVLGQNLSYNSSTSQIDPIDISTLNLPNDFYIEYYTDHKSYAFQEQSFPLSDEYLINSTQFLDINNNPIKENPSIPTSNNLKMNYSVVYVKEADDTINGQKTSIFGPMYRGWGQFGYRAYEVNSVPFDATDPSSIPELRTTIEEDELKSLGNDIDSDAIQAQIDTCKNSEGNCFDSSSMNSYDALNPQKANFISFSARREEQKVITGTTTATTVTDKWVGYDNLNYVTQKSFQSSRFGEDDIEQLVEIYEPPHLDPSIGTAGIYVQPGIVQKSKSNSGSVSFSGGAGGFSIGTSISKGESQDTQTFMDMNGDRYPDILVDGKIRYTLPNSVYEESIRGVDGMDSVTLTGSISSGASASGTFKVAEFQKGDTVKVGGGKKQASVDQPVKAGSAATSAGITVDLGSETSDTRKMWLDINGDGLTDRVGEDGAVKLNMGYSLTGEPGDWNFTLPTTTSTNYSLGAGYSNNYNSFSGGFNIGGANGNSDVNFVDLNGDGLPDYLIQDEDEDDIIYVLNTGEKFSGSGKIINHENNKSSSLSAGINGSATGCIPIPIAGIKICINPKFSINNKSISRVKTSYNDINGDGFTDLLYSESDRLKVRLNKTANTNYLKKVTMPMGGTWEVTYKKVGNEYKLPHAKWVMDTLKVNDNFTLDSKFTPDSTKISVEYSSPEYSRRERQFYGFGTVKISQLDVKNSDKPFRSTKQEYLTGNYFEKGLIKTEELLDSDEKTWTKTLTDYTFLDRGVATTSISSLVRGADKSLTNYTCVVLPYKTTKNFYEGDSNATPKSTYTLVQGIDEYGNVTKFYDHGEGGEDAVISEISYHDDAVLLEANLTGLPQELTVFKSDGTTALRKRTTTLVDNYNENEYKLGLGDIRTITMENGNTEGVFDNSQEYTLYYDYELEPTLNPSIDTLFPDNGTSDVPTEPYGNLRLSVKSPNDSSSGRMWHRYQYDSKLHTYPIKVQDAFGYYSTINEEHYNYFYGVPLYTVDMNNQAMRTKLDTKGRPTEITGPNEMFLEQGGLKLWTIKFDYPQVFDPTGADVTTGKMPEKGWYANTYHFNLEEDEITDQNKVNTHIGIPTITISDGLGKPVQVKKAVSVFAGEGANDNLVYVLPGKVETDAFGRALKTYLPTEEEYIAPPIGITTANASVEYNESISDAIPSEATYDVMDRPLTMKQPGETASARITYSLASAKDHEDTPYNPYDSSDGIFFKTQTIDELDRKQESFTDIKGRNVMVKQYSSQGDISTKFEYDAIGQLINVTDVQGNVTTSTYDNLGRRIKLVHPDNGTTTFKYDNGNNLTERLTMNLSEAGAEPIKYNYTFNRLDAIEYPQNPENNVNYYYGNMEDASESDDNVVGRLWYQTDASGTQYFKYGRQGELVYNRRSVAVAGYDELEDTQVYWFETKWKYDSWNRVREIIYPDNETVTYHYNPTSGSLAQVTSNKPNTGEPEQDIVTQIGYDHFEQRTFLKYGNGTTMNYEYEKDRRRLLRMNAFTSNDADGGKYQFIKNFYQYDPVGNIIYLSNNVELPQAGMLGGPSQHSFAYDDLNRLTSAQGSWKGTDQEASTPVETEEGITTDNAVNRKRYTLSMGYDQMHNIVNKHVKVEKNASSNSASDVWEIINADSYGLQYSGYDFGFPQVHAPKQIIEQPLFKGCCATDSPDVKTKKFEYDHNGNQIRVSHTSCNDSIKVVEKVTLWDEENRMRAVDLTPMEGTDLPHKLQINTYDASGERIIKHQATGQFIAENAGVEAENTTTNSFTLYPSGMLVMHLTPVSDAEGNTTYEPRYTKHYYVGTQRVMSKNGNTTNLGVFLNEWKLQVQANAEPTVSEIQAAMAVQDSAIASVKQIFANWQIPNTLPPTAETNGGGDTQFSNYADSFVISTENPTEQDRFYYHPDHLGSTSYVTDANGNISQHEEYIPFGESFVSEHKNSSNQPWKYNAKEFDDDTKLYYYGARYYNPTTSLWLSVDPLAVYNPVMETEHYGDGQHNGGIFNNKNLNVYGYCYQNPLRYVDPNGKQVDIVVEGGLVGHTFIIVGSATDNPTVYTYGRYGLLGKNKAIRSDSGGTGILNQTNRYGEGVLIKYTGKEALAFTKKYVKENGAQAYRITTSEEAKVREFFESKFNSSNKTPTSGDFKGKDNARVIDTYDLLRNNCTTISLDGVESGMYDEKSYTYGEKIKYTSSYIYTSEQAEKTVNANKPSILKNLLINAEKDPASPVMDITEYYRDLEIE